MFIGLTERVYSTKRNTEKGLGEDPTKDSTMCLGDMRVG